jgi:hypothetical protein
MSPDLARRRTLLTAALGLALLDTRGQPAPPEVQTVRKWRDNWTGLGHVGKTGEGRAPTPAEDVLFPGCVDR